ncbi:MAG: 4-hydroxy-3-methylbut-2-enyl diphosphate reductase [Candidatus Lightella neohaematopini]|nr:4-hydroxy-3-methylbut-2-enyl diphosphate reductase [Candidatus Lightella neohaematopini]
MKIILAKPRGFCAGVIRAINIIRQILNTYKSPIYMNHELVHNNHIVNYLKNNGVIINRNINNIPNGSVFIISAHGASKNVFNNAYKKNLNIFDTTCPLVKKIHYRASYANNNNIDTIIIGNPKHQEVLGIIGQYDRTTTYIVESLYDANYIKIKNSSKLCFLTQTTLSVFDTYQIINVLKNRFPNILELGRNNICYATNNRQQVVYKLAKTTDLVIIIGSNISSNANKLLIVAKKYNKNVYMIDNFSYFKKQWLNNVSTIGITSSASTPEFLVKQFIEYIKQYDNMIIKEIIFNKEKVLFELPKIFKTKQNIIYYDK